MSSSFLRFIPPMIPAQVENPVSGEGWIHEIKFDGYRTQLLIKDGRARLLTRNGHDWTDRYAPLARAATKLKAKSAVIDGEVIATRPDGAPHFAGLRHAIGNEPERLMFVAFDMMHLNGDDIRQRPLIERRAMLQKLVGRGGDRICFSEPFDGDAETIFRHIDELGLEGMVSKRPESTYRGGLTKSWLKVKCYQESEFEIIGIERKENGPVVALLAREGTYAGKAAVTLSRWTRDAFWKRVEEKSASNPTINMRRPGATWVKPGLVGRIRHLRGEEELRHATVRGFSEPDVD